MPHISFSELKNWNFCPFYHKLVHIDKVSGFKGNEYTAFGTAIHDVCEKQVIKEDKTAVDHFLRRFEEELQDLDSDVEIRDDLVASMREQGAMLAPEAVPMLSEVFGPYEVVSAEEKLYEPIDGVANYTFKGFIDLVIKTSDGKYHIIDWKTCSWGWDRRRKADPMTTYQLTLYKHFWSKKHDIDENQIETHFALLKRTAKKDRVEIFRVTSGTKKTTNALNLLHKALHNIQKGTCMKNRLSCTSGYGCDLYKTEHCP